MLVTLILIGSGLAFAVAKSGVLEVPLFSMWYQGPQPARLVTPVALDQAGLNALIAQRLQQQAEQHAAPYTVNVTESELSGDVLSQAKAALQAKGWSIENLQVAILPSGLQAYGRLVKAPWHVDFLLNFQASVSNGVLHFTISHVQVGDYPLPTSFAIQSLSSFFGQDLSTWSIDLGSAGLRDVQLHDGSLDLILNGV